MYVQQQYVLHMNVHSHIPRSIRASVLCACASTTWWHLNQLFAGSKPSRTLLCLVSVSFGFKGDTTGTVPHPCSTDRAFICQICPLWASPLSPPAPSTGTPFNRAKVKQTFKTHREGFTQNELRPLIACCLRCFSTERCKQGQFNFALSAFCMAQFQILWALRSFCVQRCIISIILQGSWRKRSCRLWLHLNTHHLLAQILC